MTTLPEEAMKAAHEAARVRDIRDERSMRERVVDALTAALPFLPVQVAVKKLEWELVSGDHYAEGVGTHYNIYETKPGLWNSVTVKPVNVRLATNVDLEAAKAAAQADYEARILSALEPSAARELALEEILREVDEIERKVWAWSGSAFLNNELEGAEDADCKTELYSELCGIGNTMHWLRTKICALSSPDHADAFPQPSRKDGGEPCGECHLQPGETCDICGAKADHADAGKVKGDGRADLERFWRPISEADKSITFEDTFDIGEGKSMTIRNSDYYWVRDADGRIYEATWSDHKGGYWWDLEGESPADPVEYMPHPLSLPSAPASEGAE